MITKKKDATALLQLYRDLFTAAGLFNTPCMIKFDKHTASDFIITSIEQKTLQGMANKPDKVIYDGKNKSPMLFQLVNNQAALYFTFDDTTVSALGNGVRFTVALDKPINGKSSIEVDIRRQG